MRIFPPVAMPPTTLGDTLLLADELAPVESPLRDLDGCPRAGMAASIDLLVGEETLLEIIAVVTRSPWRD